MRGSNQSYVMCALAILKRGPQSLCFKSTGPWRLLEESTAMVKSQIDIVKAHIASATVKSPIDREEWQQRCHRWQDDRFQLEVDWTSSTWWKPNWWTLEDRYKHTILARLDRQLKNKCNRDPLQVQWKYIGYEGTADEYMEDFIMDFRAVTNWDLKTECVRHIRVSFAVLKYTTRYQ